MPDRQTPESGFAGWATAATEKWKRLSRDRRSEDCCGVLLIIKTK
jgi:hypothetical protein